jgi:hypothetical protein
MSPFVAGRLLRPTSNTSCPVAVSTVCVYLYQLNPTYTQSMLLSRFLVFHASVITFYFQRHPSTTNVLCTQLSASSLLTSQLSTRDHLLSSNYLTYSFLLFRCIHLCAICHFVIQRTFTVTPGFIFKNLPILNIWSRGVSFFRTPRTLPPSRSGLPKDIGSNYQ